MKLIAAKLILVLSLGAIAAESSTSVKSNNQITLYTEINHPYVYYKDSTNELTGIAYEIVQEILKRTDLVANIEVMPWLRLLKRQSKDPNSCIFIMNNTLERRDKYRWVGPMILGGLALYKHKDSKIEITSLEQLKNYTVVAKIDGVAGKGLDTNHGATLVKAQNDRTAARMFAKGRGDLWAAGIVDGPLAAQYVGIPQPVIAFRMSSTELSMGCSLGLPDSSYKQLVDAHEAIADIRKDILERYKYGQQGK